MTSEFVEIVLKLSNLSCFNVQVCYFISNNDRHKKWANMLICIQIRVVVEAGTSETKTETEAWVAETKTETEAI